MGTVTQQGHGRDACTVCQDEGEIFFGDALIPNESDIPAPVRPSIRRRAYRSLTKDSPAVSAEKLARQQHDRELERLFVLAVDLLKTATDPVHTRRLREVVGRHMLAHYGVTPYRQRSSEEAVDDDRAAPTMVVDREESARSGAGGEVGLLNALADQYLLSLIEDCGEMSLEGYGAELKTWLAQRWEALASDNFARARRLVREIFESARGLA